MNAVFTEFASQAYFRMANEMALESFRATQKLSLYTFIWTGDCEASLVVDGVPIIVAPHSILSLTPNQFLQFLKGSNIKVLEFNREFYCIKDHDKEVGCAGLLFFGNNSIPIVKLDEGEQTKFNLLHEVFLEELDTSDTIQAEMLRMLLARFIIKTTRLLKKKEDLSLNTDPKTELFRQFNFLVENHFREAHSVQFYADALNKSPKTLANTFNKLDRSPLKIIHDRIILEAKRQLTYTDKSAKEIAYDIGFEDASHLSRLFKKHTSQTLSGYRKQQLSA